MDAMVSTATRSGPLAEQRLRWHRRTDGAIPIVVAATFLLGATALSRSFLDGRLSSPMTHNDVNYFIDGIQHLTILRTNGLGALFDRFIHDFMHAPISTYQAMLAYMVFGLNDWAPYVSNIAYVVLFLGVGAYLLRGCPNIVVAAGMACLISMPISSNMITEFAPETVCSVFTAIAVVLMMRLRLLDAPLRPRFIAGLFFNVGFLAHPSAFAFTTIALVGTCGMIFLRDIVFSQKFKKIGIGLLYSSVNLLLSVWLAALYMGPRFNIYWDYFYSTILDHSYTYFYPSIRWHDLLLYFITGAGGHFMFGDQIWLYAVVVSLGLAAACWRKDVQAFTRQIELLPLIFVFWLVPTLPTSTNYLFAQAFGFTVAFLVIIALRSLYESMQGIRGGIALATLGALLLLNSRSSFAIPNVPSNTIDREFAFHAIERLRADLLGNATQDHGIKVYLTNHGAYAPNILQYYLLKTDPTLDWSLTTNFPASGLKQHIEFIRDSRPDFVIAAQRGNGLTYSRYTWPQAENAALRAMERDPDYMPIDRFYGPNGGTVTVFQRRVKFGGWHPISGLKRWTTTQDAPRLSAGKTTYLRTFAARPVKADLTIDCYGTAGEKITLFVNQEEKVEMTTAADGTASLNQEIDLAAGQNDLVFRYSSSSNPVVFQRLLVIPQIGSAEKE